MSEYPSKVTVVADQSDHQAALLRILNAVWRRRWLLLSPLLFLSPLVVAAALVLPQTYVARTLLLLQEKPTSRPLSAREGGQDLWRDKQPALEALLKSDYLLKRAVDHASPPQSGAAAQDTARKIKDLRSDLSISTIGQEFVELRLQGSKVEGLGDELQAITALLLESLMAQDARAAAPGLILQQYKRDVERATARKERAEKELADALTDHALPPAGQVLARETAPTLDDQDFSRLRGAVAAADNEISARTRSLKDAEQIYAKYHTPGTLGLLASPERILVVDPPTDPVFPKYSRLMLGLGGLAALAVFGVLLALLVELADPTIREFSEYERITGAPVVARLPNVPNPLAIPRKGAFSRFRFAILSLLVIAALIAAAIDKDLLVRSAITLTRLQ